jgi:hypothetical protein
MQIGLNLAQSRPALVSKYLRHKVGGSLVSVVLSQAFDEVAAKCS